MNNSGVHRTLLLACAAFMWTACFSASTPKDPTTLSSEDPATAGLFILDAAGPPAPPTPPTSKDTSTGPEDAPEQDAGPADAGSAPDITIPDFSAPEDTGETQDTAPVEDTTPSDVTIPDAIQDASLTDSAVEDVGQEDTATDAAVEPDSTSEDVTGLDAPVPCEGINCPGAQAPQWQIEDFQPQSPWFGEVYGLDKFKGKVTVMVLLAGW